MTLLDELVGKLDALPADERAALTAKVAKDAATRKFTPSPGPQTEAWFCKADVLLYGGEGGGGKTGLLCGLALEAHTNSLIMRRNGVDLHGGGGVIEDLLRLNGTRDGFNGSNPPTLRTNDSRIITFGAATNVGDEEKYQGRARDFLGIDEATQFAEAQIRFLMGWMRTIRQGQRVRVVLATNPPLSSVGEWVIKMFRPWLDTTHPNPARPGELRWYITTADGDEEVDGPEPVIRGNDTLIPLSRTFIPARLADNPFIDQAQYQKQLDALPEPYRSSVRDGNFMAARQDDEFQVIPTAWLREAQARWQANPPAHAPMTALAADIAQGGLDTTTIATRYDAWFAPCKQFPGRETPTGNEVAGIVVAERRNGCAIGIDMGGGYGGSTAMRLKDNGIEVVGHKGSEASVRRTSDNLLGFFNKRAEVYWRFREALDPAQDGGSMIALADDPELISDLTAPRFEVTSRGIKITPKDKVVEMLGRSPDKGDATVICWSVGPKLATHGNTWRKWSTDTGPRGTKTVNMGRMAARRR